MVFLYVLLSLLISRLAANPVVGPISKDFETWLNSAGYRDYNFGRTDIGPSGSYGGRQNSNDVISRRPVIFIHGNSDTAVASSPVFTGWSASIDYFQQNGYTSAELYATTWGDNVEANFQKRIHDCDTVIRLRKFFEAVLQYTNVTQIDVVTHSMGVTLARKVIKGGNLQGTAKNCNIGANLSNRINVFIGLAGANYGLCACTGVATEIFPTCNKINGFWSGEGHGNCTMTASATANNLNMEYSEYLMDLNRNPNLEGKNVFSIWSEGDDLITNGCNVWGRSTALIPTSNNFQVFSNLTHMQTKDLTVQAQYEYILRN